MEKFKVGYTTGVFDMFHVGHLNILETAKKFCDFLIVGVTTDELCMQRKGKLPIVCQNDRVRIVEAIKYVDKVVLQSDMDKLNAVKQLNADVVFVGSDWEKTPEWIEYEKQFDSIGVKVMYLPHTDGISSSILREKIDQ